MTTYRTTAEAIKSTLQGDYNGCGNLGTAMDLAYSLTTQVSTCASRKGYPLSTSDQELIERLLGAHYYQMSDPGYTQRSTGKASGSFRGVTSSSIDGTLYGQAAVNVDVSGCLNAIGKRQSAGGEHLGSDVRGCFGGPW